MKPVLIFMLIVSLCLAVTLTASSEDGPNYTSMVYPGIDGKLVYAPDSLGNIIPDFSSAGYGGGGVMLPIVQNKVTIWGVEGDASPVIQAAIDSVSAMPLDENGFRGAVLLRAGYYDLHSTITINASGVVLRGQGQDDLGTILTGRGKQRGSMNSAGMIHVYGESGMVPDEDTAQKIVGDYVPVGTWTFTVERARGFKVGDKVILRRVGNEEWISEIGMDGADGNRTRWRPFTISYDRIITAIDGNDITLDAPLMCAIEEQWGGGDIVKYEDTGRIENVGIENLRAVSDFDQGVRTNRYTNIDRDPYIAEEYYSDENHWGNFIRINSAKNCWVRDITALHFVSSLVIVEKDAKWVTIQDCANLEPVSMRSGARRRAFCLDGQLTLCQRCTSDKGRHSFVTDWDEAAGPNVFLDCVATRSYGSSEPHNSWVTGELHDNVEGPQGVRFWKDFIIGWAGANTVFWNCEGEFRIQSPPTAENYTFGHIGVNATALNYSFIDNSKPDGYMESLDRHVTPRSLYLKQLEDRLGPQAVSLIAK
ncbi:hypothetical protein ACFL6K_04245 [Candidatus Latescibacterota bacterium]